jgi:O-antigen/teichoic acid export membrane protein
LVSYVLLADFGIGKNLLRLLAQDRPLEARHRHIGVALGLYVMLCGAWFAAAPVLALAIPRYLFPVEPQFLAAVRWIVVLSLVEFALGVPASLMQTNCVAGQRFEAYATFTVASGLLRSGAILAAAMIFHDPVAVAAAMAGRKLIEFFLAVKLLGRLPAAACRPVFDLRSFRSMLGQSATLSAAQILNSTLMGIGSPLVNAAFGLQALGVYRAAFDLAGKIAFVSNGVTLVVFPRAARYFGGASLAGGAAQFSAILNASTALYTWFAGFAVLAAPLVLRAMGLQDATVRLFLLLVVALSLNAHSLLGNELIQAAGRYGLSICYSGSALLTLVALFPATTRAAGAMAIGWSWIGAALVSTCAADCLLLHLCKASKARQLAAIATRAVAAAACIGFVLWQFGTASGVIARLCGAVLLALGAFAVRGAIPLLRAGREKEISGEAVAPPVYV